MKKRLLVMSMAALMVMNLAACNMLSGADHDAEEEEVAVVEQVEPEHEKPELVNPEVVEEEPEEKIEEITYSEYNISKIVTAFHNDRAWVIYNDGEGKKMGLIDTEGKVVFSESINDNTDKCYIFNKSAYSRINKSDYVIVDLDGNELYRTQNEEHHIISIEAAYDDIYLMCEENESFEEKTKVWYFTDCNGNKLTDDYPVSGKIDKLRDLGKGVLYDGNNFINFNTKEVYFVDDLAGLVSHEDTEYMYTCCDEAKILYMPIYDYTGYHGYFIMNPEDYSSKENLDNWVENSKIVEDYRYYEFENGYYFNKESDNSYAVYNSDKQVVAEHEYPDGVRIYKKSDFCDGYASIMMYGVDGEQYVSLVDTNGEMVYEPVINPSESDYDALLKGGYILLINEIVTPSGEIVSLEDDISSLELPECIVDGYQYADGEECGVSCGYLKPFGGEGFISVDSDKVLNKVLVEE